MLRSIFADRAMKRYVTVAVFALTGLLLAVLVFLSDASRTLTVLASSEGLVLDSEPDVEDIWQPESGTYNDFVMLVQQANGTWNGPEVAYVVLEELPAVEAQAQFTYLPAIPLSEDLQRFTFNRCQELDLEYELVLALMWRESRFQVNAVGYNTNGTKDNGVMQINDINRGWLREQYGITDLMDPYQNITAGTAILADFMNTYEDENIALMAYNFGEGGMRKQLANGVTTTKTVQQVNEKRDSFKEMIQNA